MTEKEFIEELSRVCSEYLDSSDLFGPSSEPVEEACIRFLQYRGFNVRRIPQVEVGKPIENIKDLIEYFYILQKKYHPEQFVYRNHAVDLALASSFVEARQEADGLTKELALQQCAAIIRTIFEEEEKFNFSFPITFSVLGQKNCGWITELAIKLINERALREQSEKEKYDIAVADEYAKKYSDLAGWPPEEIDRILNSLEGKQ